jgi:CspA family cold shock protein
MEAGKIKRLTDRGFGFIEASDGAEVFFHRSECQSVEFDSLKEGQEVSFDRESDAKGPRARNVRLSKPA